MDVIPILLIVIGLPVTLGIGYAFYASWIDLKQKQIGAMSSEAAEKAAQYAAKTERLEQRVATLERILTDRSTTLAEEIEDLREKPLN